VENNKAYEIIHFAESFLGVKLVDWQKEMLWAMYNKSKDMKNPRFIWSDGQWQLVDLEELK
jgi:hypothetical protein